MGRGAPPPRVYSTAKTFATGVTAVSPAALLLFGGSLAVHANAGTLVMDGWAAFRAPAKTALLVAAARDRLDGLLARKCDAPGEEVLGGDGAAVIDAIVRMLVDS